MALQSHADPTVIEPDTEVDLLSGTLPHRHRPRLPIRAVRRELRLRRRTTLADAFRGRENNLIALRLAMALTVLFSHCYWISLGDGHGDLLWQATRAWWGTPTGMTSGFICVSLFFVFSGFLITHSFVRSPQLIRFAIKRMARIYPPFILSALFAVLVIGPLAGQTLLADSMPSFARDVLLLWPYDIRGIFADNPLPGIVNGSLWTIKYEFVCYGLITLLWLTGLLTRRRVILGLWGAAATVYALQVVGTLDAMGIRLVWPNIVARLFGMAEAWPRMLTYHLAGMTLYLYRDRLPYSRWAAIGALAALASCILVSQTLTFVCLPLLAGFAGLHVGLSTVGRSVTRRLDKLDLSYGCYLFAFPIQQLIVQRVPGVAGQPLVLFLLAAPLTLACAILSARLVENPIAAWFAKDKARRSTPRTTGTPQAGAMNRVIRTAA